MGDRNAPFWKKDIAGQPAGCVGPSSQQCKQAATDSTAAAFNVTDETAVLELLGIPINILQRAVYAHDWGKNCYA